MKKRSKKNYATLEEIESAVEEWWRYINTKEEGGLDGGITPEVYDGPETITFSLVSNSAPELRGLGELVQAEEPHVYVEGVKDPQSPVKFDDIYPNFGPVEIEEGVLLNHGPFDTDPQNKFSEYLSEKGVDPEDFILYIFSSNDLDKGTVERRNYENVINKELVFLIDSEETRRGYTLIGIFDEEKPVNSGIKPATKKEVEIVENSFRDAQAEISSFL